MKHIAIIGGGVSGMAAAIAAAEQDPSARITILEHKPQLGKKILVTGNGHCNLANTHLTPDCYRSEDPRFIQAVKRPAGRTRSGFSRIWAFLSGQRETISIPVPARPPQS